MPKHLIAFYALLSLTLITPAAPAERLSDAARLRKLSLQIRGVLPPDSDYAQLQSESNKEEFFRSKTREYLGTRWSDQKIAQRIMEDFRVSIADEEVITRNSKSLDGNKDAPAPDLFLYGLLAPLQAAVQTNLSWNDIYLGKKISELSLIANWTQSLMLRRLKIKRFISKAKELGYKFDSEASVKEAIEAFRKDRTRFGHTYVYLNDRDLAHAIAAEAAKLYAEPSLLTKFEQELKKIPSAAPLRGTKENLRSALKTVENANAFPALNALLNSIQGLPLQLTFAGDLEIDTIGFAANLNYSLPPKMFTGAEIKTYSCLWHEWLIREAKMSAKLQSTQFYNGYAMGNIGCTAADPTIHESLASFPEVTARFLQIYADEDDIRQADNLNQYILKLFADNSGSNPKINLTDPYFANQDKPTPFANNQINQRYNKSRYSMPAAMFRVFLCDEMKAVALVDAKKKSMQVAGLISFDRLAALPGSAASNVSIDVRHVQPQCVTCHRKLDPAEKLSRGNSFANPAAALPEDEIVEFTYDDDSGRELKFKVNGFKNLGLEMSKQPQYASCQSQKFWKWYIGEDYPITPEMQKYLAQRLASSGWNFRDLIAELVNRPEFYDSRGMNAAPTLSSLKPFLNRCTSCHVDEGVPSFVQFPINGSPESHVKWITKIFEVTDAVHFGANAEMPPKQANWVLTPQDHQLLLRWLWNLARDEDNQPTITAYERNRILSRASPEMVSSLSTPLTPKATFRDTWSRYFENFDLAKVLSQKVHLNESCLNSIRQLAPGLGFNDQNTGAPNSDLPGPTYVKLVSRCLSDALRDNTPSYVFSDKNEDWKNESWSGVSPQDRETMIEEVIQATVGPSVLTNEELADLKAVILRAVQNRKNETRRSVITAAIYLTIMDEKFLTY